VGTIIKIVGIGEIGVQVLDDIILKIIENVEFISMDTDSARLEGSRAHRKILLEPDFEKGIPFFEQNKAISNALASADLIVLVSGVRNETEAAAPSVIANIVKNTGALIVSFAVIPFSDEKTECPNSANSGVFLLMENSDALMICPGEKLTDNHENTIKSLYDVLYYDIRALAEMLLPAGNALFDIGDICSILGDAGVFSISVGEGYGKNKVRDAVEKAVNGSLTPMKGAAAVLSVIKGGNDLGLHDIEQAASLLFDALNLDSDAKFLWGHAHDPNMSDSIKLTIMAAGMNEPFVNS
jgi:cell division protein FtsZ